MLKRQLSQSKGEDRLLDTTATIRVWIFAEEEQIVEKTYLIVLCNDYGLIKELDICGCSHKNGVKTDGHFVDIFC